MLFLYEYPHSNLGCYYFYYMRIFYGIFFILKLFIINIIFMF